MTLTIGSDNTAAFILAGRLKAKVKRAIICRELALMYAESSFEPQVIIHIPGVSNTIPDTLSRIFEPGKNYSIPTILADVEPQVAPLRDESWYRTLPYRPRDAGGKMRGL